jgi:phage FluMu protein Com
MNDIRCPACNRLLFRAGHGEIEIEIKCAKCGETVEIEPSQRPRIINEMTLETRAPQERQSPDLRGPQNGATHSVIRPR